MIDVYDNETGAQIGSITDAELKVLADARGLRTVLGNLLQNALVFSPPDTDVEVSAHRSDGGWTIVVQHAGGEIQAEELARLLRPFEQGENALTRHAEGAGLGLAICDLTCRAMGGRLHLVSGPGQGFAAHVELPAA